MKSILLSLALCVASVPAPAFAQQSIAGEWDATMSTPGGVRNFKIVFQIAGNAVTGTVKRPTGELVPLTGKIKGDTLTFSYTIQYEGSPLTLTMIVTVAGDTMKGIVDFGGAAQDDFSAKRASSPP